jgi:excisionase family DNA binding protein
MSHTAPKIAYSIREFEQALGISHSTIYELIASGELQTFNIGRRRFISVEAGRAFVLKREAAAS